MNQSATWYYSAQIHQHRKREHSAQSRHKNLYHTLSYTQFMQVKRIAKDEIIIEGKMFDVKLIEYSKEGVILFGHFDQEEDGLLAKAKEHESRKENKLKNYKAPLLFIEDFSFSESSLSLSLDFEKYYPFSEQIQSVCQSADSPPPKFV